MKTAIIIGATSGLGREAAARLVAEGWKVGIAGRRTAALEAFQNEFGKDKVCIATMDVTRPESVEALDALLSQTGDPDLFFYVSGVGFQNRELDEEKEIRIIQTNSEGMVRMVDHFFNYVRTHNYSNNHKAHPKRCRAPILRLCHNSPVWTRFPFASPTYAPVLSQRIS